MAVVTLIKPAQKQLSELPEPIVERMARLVERLQKWPEVSGAKPLSGNLAGHYRLRTGDYRMQFRVEGETVFIEKIGHRDKFYRD